jgi:hypothetical protein
MSEVGKYGKEIQAPRARDVRKIDREPPKPTPKKTEKAPLKRFGYACEYRHWFFAEKWSTHILWFKSAASRDYALQRAIRADEERMTSIERISGKRRNAARIRNWQKVQR